jgi:hypothetical protein
MHTRCVLQCTDRIAWPLGCAPQEDADDASEAAEEDSEGEGEEGGAFVVNDGYLSEDEGCGEGGAGEGGCGRSSAGSRREVSGFWVWVGLRALGLGGSRRPPGRRILVVRGVVLKPWTHHVPTMMDE